MVNEFGEFAIGTKNYDSDWYLSYGLSYKEAARLLRSWGFSFVMTQSRYLPMPDSAVISVVTPKMKERYKSYDDLKFREALDEEGIGYWPTLCTFFNPMAVEDNPELRPIDSNGNPMEMIDWYLGVTPSYESYVDRQVEAVASVVEKLQPEGIFLSFIRWPGFWELWMPYHSRDNFPEYSFDSNSLKRFANETSNNVPAKEPKDVSNWIRKNALEAWTTWKCSLITDVVRQIGKEAKSIKPDIQIMINTLPFGETEYDEARKKTFGQDLISLSEVVDIFEVMTYHQILNRPIHWIHTIGQEVKQITGKKTLCTIQAEPLYLDGMHAKEERSTEIDDNEFSQAVKSVESGNLDGVVVFVWSDLLRKTMVEKDFSRIEILQSSIKRRGDRLNRE